MQWGPLILSYAALFALALVDSGRGPSYPDILQHFNIGPGTGSHFFALGALAGLAANLTARRWLESWGSMRAMKYAMLILAVASLSIGLAGLYPFPKSMGLAALFAAACIYGLGSAITSVTINIVTARSAGPLVRRKALAGLHSIYGISSMAAPLALSVLAHMHLDWRHYFTALALLPLTIWVAGRKVELVALPMGHKLVVPNISLWLKVCFGGVFAMYAAAEVLISSRLALYLESVHHYSGDHARLAVSAFFLLLLSGRLLFGIKQLPGPSAWYLYGSLGLTFLAYFVAFFVHPLGFVACALCMSWYYPCAMAWASERYVEGSDYMISVAQTCVGIMLVSMHWGFGAVSAALGVDQAMRLAPVLSLMAVGCLVVSQRKTKAG